MRVDRIPFCHAAQGGFYEMTSLNAKIIALGKSGIFLGARLDLVVLQPPEA